MLLVIHAGSGGIAVENGLKWEIIVEGQCDVIEAVERPIKRIGVFAQAVDFKLMRCQTPFSGR